MALRKFLNWFNDECDHAGNNEAINLRYVGLNIKNLFIDRKFEQNAAFYFLGERKGKLSMGLIGDVMSKCTAHDNLIVEKCEPERRNFSMKKIIKLKWGERGRGYLQNRR